MAACYYAWHNPAFVHLGDIDFGKVILMGQKVSTAERLETGDTLEIRASLVVRSGTYDGQPQYQDAVCTWYCCSYQASVRVLYK